MKDTFLKSLTCAVGIFLVITGVACNEWLLRDLLSLDGVLNFASRMLTWLFDLALVSLGLFFMIRKDARVLAKLCLSLISLVLTLLMLEAVLSYRAVGILIRETNVPFRLRPNINFKKELGGKIYQFRTNSHGMRWREVSYENPQNRKRIAVVGDSLTFGCCADTLEKSFVGTFESRLDSARFEVLNFGVPGYGPVEEQLLIKYEVLRFQPEYILLMFYVGNDFSDSFRRLNRWQQIASLITDRTVFWNLLGSSSDDAFFTRPPYTANARKAIDVTLQVLQDIKRLCDDNHAQLLLVAIPFQEQVYSSSLSGEGFDYRLPQKYIDDFAKDHFVLYLDLLPLLRSCWSRYHKKLFDQNDIHFNNEGHRIVGELLADFFKTEVLKK